MVALVATAIPGTLVVAQAQDVAAKPDFRRLEIIIPYSAGGGTDTLCRRLVEDLRPKVDATIMVRNMPGDSAMTGLSRIQRAAPNEAILGFHNPPTDFALFQNYPNPFNPSTKISFDLPDKSNVSLKVFNLLGEQVAELVNETLDSGKYEYQFNSRALASGIYFYKLDAQGIDGSTHFVDVKKMILMK